MGKERPLFSKGWWESLVRKKVDVDLYLLPYFKQTNKNLNSECIKNLHAQAKMLKFTFHDITIWGIRRNFLRMTLRRQCLEK